MKLRAGQFYGETSQTLLAEGFRFTEKTYSTYANLPVHAHELSHFCLVLTGKYREKIGSRLFEREPTALVYYPPEVSHAEEHFANGRHFLVEIASRRLEKVKDYGATLREPVFLNDESSFLLASRMYREFSDRDAFSPLALESLTTELLISTSRQHRKKAEKQPPVWLEQVKEYLRENFSQPPGLNELAKAAGVHPTHLARVFRQFERCTAGDYVRRMRIEFARKKIIETNDPLIGIAIDAGFADQSHFSRTFKRETGMNPTEFRRLFKSR